MKYFLFSFLIVFQCITAELHAEPTNLFIRGIPAGDPSTETYSPSDDPVIQPLDSGEILSALPGISTSRMGGHALEPVIRGQQQNQINVSNNGVYSFGGCPNRMDPPSSLADLGVASSIIVERGYSSVTHGPGGAAGGIRIINLTPDYKKGQFQSDVRSSWESNGSRYNESGQFAFVQKDYFLRGRGHWKDADNYKDGHGNEVRSSFRSEASGIDGGYQLTNNSQMTIGIEQQRVTDALFPGAAMDGIYDRVRTGRIGYEYKNREETLQRVFLLGYKSNVIHTMDNYSARENISGPFAKADSTSNTSGGKLALGFDAGHPLTLGMDVLEVDRDARRFAGPLTGVDPSKIQSYLWPDTTIRNLGFFSESDISLSSKWTTRVGLRYDNVYSDARDLDKKSEIPTADGKFISPQDLYSSTYTSATVRDREHNYGGLLRLEYALRENIKAIAGYSRVLRAPDASERFIASAKGADSWIGNPDLRSEQHNQFELGITRTVEKSSISLSLFVDEVDNFILKDTARGQDGIKRSDGATIYRNIDAQLAGTEFIISQEITPAIFLRSDATYTYGENQEDSGPLPQIPPLSGSTTVTYEIEKITTGIRARYALQQTRTDRDPTTGTGRDVRDTPAWGVFDIFTNYNVYKNIDLQFGIKNLFDKYYATHLNRTNAFDPLEVQVNEPGRSFAVGITGAF